MFYIMSPALFMELCVSFVFVVHVPVVYRPCTWLDMTVSPHSIIGAGRNK